MKQSVFAFCAALVISGCGEQPSAPEQTEIVEQTPAIDSGSSQSTSEQVAPPSLDEVLAAQPEETQARYQFRHPKETLEFFGIQPGMAVAEALPGGGWYSKILLPYLGSDGKLIGIDYDIDMWPHFGFVTEAFIEGRVNWSEDWAAEARGWTDDSGASIEAYTFATIPEEHTGTLDAVLFVRALHNLNRFKDKGDYIGHAIGESFRILKPGGVAGVVQHMASEEKPDEWADGSRGYLKKSKVISQFEAAGFTFEGESAVNQNPNDQPAEEDVVWRLPPSLSTSREDESIKEKMLEIGESNRMTLLFRKPN